MLHIYTILTGILNACEWQMWPGVFGLVGKPWLTARVVALAANGLLCDTHKMTSALHNHLYRMRAAVTNRIGHEKYIRSEIGKGDMCVAEIVLCCPRPKPASYITISLIIVIWSLFYVVTTLIPHTVLHIILST